MAAKKTKACPKCKVDYLKDETQSAAIDALGSCLTCRSIDRPKGSSLMGDLDLVRKELAKRKAGVSK